MIKQLSIFFLMGAFAAGVRAEGLLSSAKGTNCVAQAKGTKMVMRVTGYCNCGKCCSWHRSWFGFGPPVYTSGSLKGKRKRVGITARGTVAKHGTVAADPKVLPFGTRLVVPGYGVGVVEDVGGAIIGNHIDVWFPSHDAARKWGSKKLTISLPAGKGMSVK